MIQIYDVLDFILLSRPNSWREILTDEWYDDMTDYDREVHAVKMFKKMDGNEEFLDEIAKLSKLVDSWNDRGFITCVRYEANAYMDLYDNAMKMVKSRLENAGEESKSGTHGWRQGGVGVSFFLDHPDDTPGMEDIMMHRIFSQDETYNVSPEIRFDFPIDKIIFPTEMKKFRDEKREFILECAEIMKNGGNSHPKMPEHEFGKNYMTIETRFHQIFMMMKYPDKIGWSNGVEVLIWSNPFSNGEKNNEN